MPATKDLWNTYAHLMDYPSRDFPLIERGNTQEIDPPYRVGVSLVARIPGTRKAIVLGKWVNKKDEDTALSDAIGARRMDYREFLNVGKEEHGC